MYRKGNRSTLTAGFQSNSEMRKIRKKKIENWKKKHVTHISLYFQLYITFCPFTFAYLLLNVPLHSISWKSHSATQMKRDALWFCDDNHFFWQAVKNLKSLKIAFCVAYHILFCSTILSCSFAKYQFSENYRLELWRHRKGATDGAKITMV